MPFDRESFPAGFTKRSVYILLTVGPRHSQVLKRSLLTKSRALRSIWLLRGRGKSCGISTTESGANPDSQTTVWEFAARYSQTEAGDDNMFVEISFHGMQGRTLFGDHERRRWFQTYGPARMDSFAFSRSLSRAELIADAGSLAVTCSADLLQAFGLDAGHELLLSMQAELLQR